MRGLRAGERLARIEDHKAGRNAVVTETTLLSRMADALRECSDALAVAVSREYGGTQRGYDAQRTAYDAAMAPVERARALLAECGGDRR